MPKLPLLQRRWNGLPSKQLKGTRALGPAAEQEDRTSPTACVHYARLDRERNYTDSRRRQRVHATYLYKWDTQLVHHESQMHNTH